LALSPPDCGGLSHWGSSFNGNERSTEPREPAHERQTSTRASDDRVYQAKKRFFTESRETQKQERRFD
jgi:hypothetical protein